LGRKINNEKQSLRHALRQEIRKEWDTKQAVAESLIERTAQHKRLIETVMSLPGLTLEDKTNRRNAAINAIIAYCTTEEGGNYRPNRQRWSNNRLASPPIKSEEDIQPTVATEPLKEKLDRAILLVYKDKRPKICFLCLGNEHRLINKRVYSFYTSGDLSKHFRRRHLSKIGKDKIECRLCHVSLDHKMHLQRHAIEIHGTVS
jgi:hypothetical protein